MDQRWIILAVLFLARTAMGFQFQSVASTAPELIADFGVDYTSIGTLIGFYNLPGVLMALPSGFLGKRFGETAIYATGLILMMWGGALIGVSHGLAMALVGRILSGAGAVLFSQALTKMVTDWFADRETVAAMGVFLASWPFGIVLGLLCQGPIARDIGWRWVMHLAALVCASALVLLAAAYRAPANTAEPKAPGLVGRTSRALPPKLQTLALTSASAMWGCLNLGLVIFFSFAPGLLQEQAIAPADAAALTSLALWILMFSVPLGGLLVQRSGRTNVAIIVFAGAAALALALLPAGRLPLVLCALFGLAVGPPAGPIMALPARVLDPEHRAVGFGLFYAFYYLILTVGPAVAGLARDHSGGSAAALFMGSVLFIAILPLLLLFRSLEAASAAARG